LLQNPLQLAPLVLVTQARRESKQEGTRGFKRLRASFRLPHSQPGA